MTLGCPTYIGKIGAMLPTPCIEEVSASFEQRVVYGGGEGTLAPRRARVYGPGARTWQMDRDRWEPTDNAAIVSLARRQSRYGGSYRVLSCDAVASNMLTPAASEDLAGWSGLTLRTVEQEPTVALGGAFPSMLGRVGAGGTATSPRVPVPAAGAVYGGLHVYGGPVAVRVRSRNALAVQVAVAEVTDPGPSTLRRLLTDLYVTPDEAVSVEVEVEATGGSAVFVAWPSLAYREGPYTTGRGGDAAYIALQSQSSRHFDWEGFSYEIVEVGV